MKILTFDACREKMYVTLSQDGIVSESRIITNTKDKYNSAFLIPTIIELLKFQKMELKDIDTLGVNIGPGSFTGVRAALTVAKVLQNQLNIKAVGISSLEIYALLNETGKATLCLLDAKRSMAYAGIYKSGKIIKEPCLLDIKEAQNLAKSDDFFIISDTFITKTLEADKELKPLNLDSVNTDFGIFLAELAFKNANKERPLIPLYIQSPPITPSKPRV
jgi:tRNA threonylcarbamoyladenosine biosynthesis protein TsaB